MHKTISLLAAAAATLAFTGTVGFAAEPPVSPSTIAAAKTAADHEAIARTYEAEAVRLEGEATTQAELAKLYGSSSAPHLYSGAMEKRCSELAREFKATASLNRDLAALHRKAASQLTK